MLFFLKFTKKRIRRNIFNLKIIVLVIRNLKNNNNIDIEQDSFTFNKIFLGSDIFLGKRLVFNSYKDGKIIIQNNCRIESNCILESIKGNIKIGENSTLNQFSIIRAIGEVSIGSGVRIGPSVQIMAMNHIFSEPTQFIYKQGLSGDGIIIGNNVWIGGNVVILDGVKIGNNCVIGASSVITKDIDDNSLVVGNPGRVVRNLDFTVGDKIDHC